MIAAFAGSARGGNRKLGGRDPGDSSASIAAILDWGPTKPAGSTVNRSWAEDNACAAAQHGSADRACGSECINVFGGTINA